MNVGRRICSRLATTEIGRAVAEVACGGKYFDATVIGMSGTVKCRHRSMRAWLGLFAGCLLLLVKGANAAYANSPIPHSCTIASTNVHFGSYDPRDTAPRKATVHVTVTCSAGTEYSISVGPGDNYDDRRKMISADGLAYELLRPASDDAGAPAGSAAWAPGDKLSGTTADDTPLTFNIGALATGSQDVGIGSYADVVTVTVDWENGSATSNVHVTANVYPHCYASTEAINRVYDGLVADSVTAVGRIAVSCVKGTHATIAIDRGQHAADSPVMASNSGDSLAYGLYQPTADTPGAAVGFAEEWGSEGAQQLVAGVADSAAPRYYNVGMRIHDGQDVGAGKYFDTVTVSVLFEGGKSSSALSVASSVAENCMITASQVTSPTYASSGAAAVVGTGTVSVRCVKGTVASVTLGRGGGFTSTRNMRGSAKLLAYELYQPESNTPGAAVGSAAWSEQAPLELAAARSNAIQHYTVGGEVSSGQRVDAGNYYDSVVATVMWAGRRATASLPVMCSVRADD